MLCNTIHDAAITEIGRNVISDINKPWITNEIVSVINQLRLERKGIISKILNRIKNIKQSTNGNITKLQIKNDLIANYGHVSYDKYVNWEYHSFNCKLTQGLSLTSLHLKKKKNCDTCCSSYLWCLW